MKFLIAILISILPQAAWGGNPDSLMAVRGLSIKIPTAEGLDRFIEFINEDLGPNGYNTLVLRVDYNYEYQSYPNLRDEEALSKSQVKQLVAAAKENNIDLIPQINLLGHQSWHSNLGNLLKEYPEFDETPNIKLPADYQWPNDDGLYCKSYCPLHPEVHQVVFALVDEIMEVFEATSFHAGMDEVFYIGMDQCPRCAGKDKAKLFADEVTRIRDHLNERGWKLWIWGDRLLDGEETGLGMWEASENQTYHAIDLIPKDVVICDWHYENATPTAAYFALKGFSVITCPWNRPKVTAEQIDMTADFLKRSNSKIAHRYQGIMQTIWTSAENFLDLYYGIKTGDSRAMGQVESFNLLADYFSQHK